MSSKNFHIIRPQAAPVLEPMMLGQTVDQLAHDVRYVLPALPEVFEEKALLEFATDRPTRSGEGAPNDLRWSASST